MRIWSVVLLILLINSCVEQKAIVVNNVVVSGHVLNRPAGLGVPAKLFFLSKGKRYSTNTNESGYFEIEIPVGTYQAEISSIDHAASRVNNISISDEHRKYDFYVLPRFSPLWPVKAPLLTLEGPEEGKGYSGKIDFRLITKTWAPIKAIYVSIGHTPGFGFVNGKQLNFYATKDTLWRSINIPPEVVGETTFEVVAYDQNNNRTQLIVPVFIEGKSIPHVKLEPVQGIKIVVITFNRTIGTSADSTQASSIIAQLQWGKYHWPEEALGRKHGFKIWRENENGEKQEIGFAAADKTAFFDRSSGLQPGKIAKYYVAPYIESELAEQEYVEVKPLRAFNIELVSPKDNSVSGIRPSFEWRANPEVGEDRIYYPVFWDNITGRIVKKLSSRGFVHDTRLDFDNTQLKPLLPGKRYGWEVSIAYAVDSKENPKAYSVAVDRDGLLGSIYVPGPFSVFEVR